MRNLPPLPNVGDFISKDFGPKNFNTWKRAGEVRAIIDNHIVVCRQRDDGEGEFYQLITPEDWTMAPRARPARFGMNLIARRIK